MKIKRSISVPLLSALVIQLSSLTTPGASSAQQNWPEWRGPEGTGVAPAGKPPVQWSETENVKWKAELPGAGSSTPIVWGDTIFVQTAIATGKKVEGQAAAEPEPPQEGGRRRGGGIPKPTEVHQFVLVAVDRATGEIKWQKVAKEEVPHEGHHRDHGFSSHSPVTDGQRVIAYFGSRGLYCYDMNGNLKWSKDLGKMQSKMSFGEGSSPALHGNMVVVNWDHEGDDFIVTFDKETGQELWREPRDEDTTWSTPLVVEHNGQAQVVTGGTKKVRSYDLKSGKQIWETKGLTRNVIPTPVAGDGMVYVMSGFSGNALYAIRLGQTGNLSDSDAVVWTHEKNTPYVPSPLLYGNRLYFLSHNNGILSCFDAKTGKPMIDSERIEGLRNVYASPVGANGHVYLLGRDGTTVVIKDADKLEIVSTNPLNDSIDASPAIAGNEIFLRGQKYLYCLAEK